MHGFYEAPWPGEAFQYPNPFFSPPAYQMVAALNPLRQLQGIGRVEAKPAGELVPGDVTIWNFGGRALVLDVKPKGKASLSVTFQWDTGEVSTRTMRRTTLTGMSMLPWDGPPPEHLSEVPISPGPRMAALAATPGDAFDLGAAAFAAGKQAVPAHDPELMAMLSGRPIGGGGAELMDAWSRGWTEANLVAPIAAPDPPYVIVNTVTEEVLYRGYATPEEASDIMLDMPPGPWAVADERDEWRRGPSTYAPWEIAQVSHAVDIGLIPESMRPEEARTPPPPPAVTAPPEADPAQLWEPDPEAVAAYEARQEDKRARLERAAIRARAEAEGQFRRGDLREEVSGIPMGQPVLVGHHSERRHRRALEKADVAMRKGLEAAGRAESLQRSAERVGTAGVSSDDPAAVQKLAEKIAGLEQGRDRMKAVNKAIRSAAKKLKIDWKSPGPEGAQRILEASGLDPETQVSMGAMYSSAPYHGLGYASYNLTSASAEIRRVKKRIKELRAEHARGETGPVQHEGFEVVENREINRIQIVLDGKPGKVTKKALKSHGFRWAPSQGAWQRQLSANGRRAAQRVAEAIVGHGGYLTNPERPSAALLQEALREAKRLSRYQGANSVTRYGPSGVHVSVWVGADGIMSRMRWYGPHGAKVTRRKADEIIARRPRENRGRQPWTKRALNAKAKAYPQFPLEWLDEDYYVTNTHGWGPYVEHHIDNDDWVTATDGRALDAEEIVDEGRGWAVVRAIWRENYEFGRDNPPQDLAARVGAFMEFQASMGVHYGTFEEAARAYQATQESLKRKVAAMGIKLPNPQDAIDRILLERISDRPGMTFDQIHLMMGGDKGLSVRSITRLKKSGAVIVHAGPDGTYRYYPGGVA